MEALTQKQKYDAVQELYWSTQINDPSYAWQTALEEVGMTDAEWIAQDDIEHDEFYRQLDAEPVDVSPSGTFIHDEGPEPECDPEAGFDPSTTHVTIPDDVYSDHSDHVVWVFVADPPDQTSSDDDWYALENGYITPEDVLADQAQVDAVNDACALLRSFFDALRDAGIREEM